LTLALLDFRPVNFIKRDYQLYSYTVPLHSPVSLKIIMNRINPDKLLMTKWSAVEPKRKERHFIVTGLVRNEEGTIIACELEAVINKNVYQAEWQELKDSTIWIMGWK